MNEIGLRECHAFEAAGQQFLYLVPSAAVFALDETSHEIVALLRDGPLTRPALITALESQRSPAEVDNSLIELQQVQAVAEVARPVEPMPKIIPVSPFPLTTMVLNVTNQCNLSCTYCYEYGEDKIVETSNGSQPKFMSEETARESVDFMLKESGENKVAYLSFFGGETLMNMSVLKFAIPYARKRAAELGKRVEFNLTTNATLLKPEVIDFLVENEVAVTISTDGPKECRISFASSRAVLVVMILPCQK